MNALEDHFLPGVSFTLDGETVPAGELCWSMIAPCGCVSGVHMMTADTITEAAAWKAMTSSAALLKREKARGFTIKMAKVKGISFDDCPHNPKWGYPKCPRPEGYSWATHGTTRVLHLVQLAESESDAEWVERVTSWDMRVASLCGKTESIVLSWTRKWYRMDGKVECAQCVKKAERLVADSAVTG